MKQWRNSKSKNIFPKKCPKSRGQAHACPLQPDWASLNKPQAKFRYKDFIPNFKAERFNARPAMTCSKWIAHLSQRAHGQYDGSARFSSLSFQAPLSRSSFTLNRSKTLL